MRHREPAICLRTTDYSETSQVVHFLTRGAGVVHLLAKGAKRPKSKSGGAIDLLGEGDLVFTVPRSDALGTLIEFSQTEARPGLRQDARRLYTAMYLIELTEAMLAEADPHPEVFDLLHNGLGRLAEPDSPTPAVLAFFQWRLLAHVGLLGDLETCVTCGRNLAQADPTERQDTWFSSFEGGLICRDCEPGAAEKYRAEPIALAGLAALQAAQAIKATGRKVTLPAAQAHAVNRLLNYHVTQQLGKVLKLARYAIADGLGPSR